MAKTKTPPTREQLIEMAKNTFKEIETTTRVRAWTFQANKKNYVMISFRNVIDYVNVYESTRAGRKTSDTAIVSLSNSTDYTSALEMALDILLPE